MNKTTTSPVSVALVAALGSLLLLSLAVIAAIPAGSGVQIYYEDWVDRDRSRTVPVKIYIPAEVSAPLPVILFSHGLGGSREAASYLCEHWADHQYICIAMQHPGSDESFWKPKAAQNPGITRAELLDEFRQTVADPRHALNRVNDVHFVLNELERRNKAPGVLQGKLDLNAIAIAGHSYGAWTALAASGQRAGRFAALQSGDPRIKAAVYLSPPAARFGDPKLIYGSIAIPGFHFTGTRDDSPIGDTKAGDRRMAYDNISGSDQYLVILKGADHMVFNGRPRAIESPLDAKQHKLTQVATTRFFDAYLKHDEKSLSWLTGSGAQKLFAGEGTFESKHPASASDLFFRSNFTKTSGRAAGWR